MEKVTIINKNLDEESKKKLSLLGCALYTLEAADYLDFPVSYHPDMLLFAGFNTLFCHEKYYCVNKHNIDDILKETNYSLCLTDEQFCKTYPNDVLFNVVLMGGYLICNTRCVSKRIIEKAKEHGKKIIHVSQGYTKCSVCKVSDNSLITSDKSIYKASLLYGIDSLLISAGNIKLEGFEYGFIGGTSGSYGKYVFFCGDISRHPDYFAISDFCKKHNKTPVSLSEKQLYDAGSILFID